MLSIIVHVTKKTMLFDENIKCHVHFDLSRASLNANGIADMLQALSMFLPDSEDDGNALLTIVLVTMEHDHSAFFGLPNSHPAQVEAISGETQTVIDANRKLAQERFFAGDARAFEGEVQSFAVG